MRDRIELLPSGEVLLLDYAERLIKHLPGRRAVHVRLSLLQPAHRRPHHLRMAAASFDGLVKRHQGQCFRLRNSDIIVVVKGVPSGELEKVVTGLRFMFDEDPVVREPDDDASDRPRFRDFYNLEHDYPRFLETARTLHRDAQTAKPVRSVAVDPDGAPAPPPADLDPLDPLRLSKLAHAIETADVTPVLRRQPVSRVPVEGTITVVCNELFVSIDALAKRVTPDVDLRADPWLFQYLVGLLDRRVMSVLPTLEGAVPLPTSLNLSLRALQSKEFLAFDEKLREVTDKPMVAEINWVDALRDVPGFAFMRDFLHTRNWSVALDGLTATNYALVKAHKLRADFIKLGWNQDLADNTPSQARADFLDAVDHCRKDRLVLMHCGEAAAVRFGLGMGITLFQGRYVDAQLRQRAAA